MKLSKSPMLEEAGSLVPAAMFYAGDLDCQANSFVSCPLSVITGSKKNARLYRGLLFFLTLKCEYSHSLTFTHFLPPWLVFV